LRRRAGMTSTSNVLDIEDCSRTEDRGLGLDLGLRGLALAVTSKTSSLGLDALASTPVTHL